MELRHPVLCQGPYTLYTALCPGHRLPLYMTPTPSCPNFGNFRKFYGFPEMSGHFLTLHMIPEIHSHMLCVLLFLPLEELRY